MSSIKLLTVVMSAMFLLIEGMYMRFNGLYFMSGVLLVMPFVSFAIARIAVRNLRADFEVPSHAREGEAIPVRVAVTGRSSLLGPIEVYDRLPEWVERTSDEPVLLVAEPEVRYSLVARKRGEYTLGPLSLLASDPLGFFSFPITPNATAKLVVLPTPIEVSGLQINPTSAFTEFSAGSPGVRGVRGGGIDFHGVREYQPGDELRRVHWLSLAKHGKLNVVEFEHLPSSDTLIAVDRRKGSVTGSGRFSSLEYAVKLAAGIAEEAMANVGNVSLAGIWDDQAVSIPSAGSEHLYRILQALARAKADSDYSLTDSLLPMLDLDRRGSEVICLVSRLDEATTRLAALLHSRGIGMKVVLIAVENSKEIAASSASGLMAAGAGLTVLECSATSMECRVNYEYTI